MSMDEDELQVYLVRSNQLYEDIFKRRQWIRSMEKSIKHCSMSGRQQIRSQIRRNLSIIDEAREFLGDQLA